mgnify:FL=1
MDNNKSVMVLGGVIVGAIIIYLVATYTQSLGTKTYVPSEEGADSSNVQVPTTLSCSLSSDDVLEAKLTVRDTVENSGALPAGSVLEAQTIHWNVAESLGKITPATSTTDSNGIARSVFKKTSDAEVPVIIAAFEANSFVIEEQGSSATVTYGTSWCELSPSN